MTALGEALLTLADSAEADPALELCVEDEQREPYWYLLRIRPHRDDDALQGYFGSAADISARKRTEQALAQGRAMAEEANRRKSSFLANMSHRNNFV